MPPFLLYHLLLSIKQTSFSLPFPTQNEYPQILCKSLENDFHFSLNWFSLKCGCFYFLSLPKLKGRILPNNCPNAGPYSVIPSHLMQKIQMLLFTSVFHSLQLSSTFLEKRRFLFLFFPFSMFWNCGFYLTDREQFSVVFVHCRRILAHHRKCCYLFLPRQPTMRQSVAMRYGAVRYGVKRYDGCYNMQQKAN